MDGFLFVCLLFFVFVFLFCDDYRERCWIHFIMDNRRTLVGAGLVQKTGENIPKMNIA